MTFKRGDTVWVKIKNDFIKAQITKIVMPYHGVSFDKNATKWYVFTSEVDFGQREVDFSQHELSSYADFRIPYYESDLISWSREKKINDTINL
jgi:hypothetical protein